MPDRPVVLNNTPLIAFWVLGRLDILRDLFGEVLIPSAVEAEFLAVEETVRRKALQQAPWIKTTALSHPRRAVAYAELDQGEAEVLALAEEQDARLVILDERKGRRYAIRMEIPLTGSLGVLLLAREAGLIDSVAACIRKLQEAGLFLSPELIAQVLEFAGESS